MATDTLDRMAEVCLEAHALIEAHGTPEMRATIRLLLLQLGRELVRREAES
ncbi:hypothetical protein AFCDBAGC_2926 [Methylobacterium cerastii]|uniref:Uncharacterized protein n=1 Tax=Methylobacterium cerastii TaxID=932741 RepID=A0ABQ4QIK1_9HYPH|nr:MULTISPECIES: hypothetical protein [Methylobacterium]GJD45057.1 hypothetical protein AFCDBAGC_2926 [Methylobacterium cerastii]